VKGEIPQEENYGDPFPDKDLTCYNCNRYKNGVREIGDGGRTRFARKFWWLCPECFKKLILKNSENAKEVVQFT